MHETTAFRGERIRQDAELHIRGLRAERESLESRLAEIHAELAAMGDTGRAIVHEVRSAERPRALLSGERTGPLRRLGDGY
jgi:hypothetical protein